MNRQHTTTGLEVDPVTKQATELAQALGERSHINQKLLIALANALAANEETQRKFRNAVLISLSRIQTRLKDVQGAQLAEYWAPGRVSDAKRAEYVRDLEERASKESYELGLEMVKYIYGESERAEPRAGRGGRQKWSGWEI